MNLFLLRLSSGYAYIIKRDNKHLIISPYHVFCKEYLEKGLFSINSSTFYKKEILFNIERITGVLNSELDLVIAEINTQNHAIKFRNIVIDSTLKVNNPLLSHFLKIEKYELTQNIPISFQNHKQIFNELIVCSKISQKGYSGKLVINSDDTLIGMLIADSSTKSYILPIAVILNYIKELVLL